MPEGRIAQGLLFGTSRTGQAPHGGMHPADHGRVLDACDVRFVECGLHCCLSQKKVPTVAMPRLAACMTKRSREAHGKRVQIPAGYYHALSISRKSPTIQPFSRFTQAMSDFQLPHPMEPAYGPKKLLVEGSRHGRFPKIPVLAFEQPCVLPRCGSNLSYQYTNRTIFKSLLHINASSQI